MDLRTIITFVSALVSMVTTWNWHEWMYVYVPKEHRLMTMQNIDLNTCINKCKMIRECEAVGIQGIDIGNYVGPCYILSQKPHYTDKAVEGSEDNLGVIYGVRNHFCTQN